MKSGRTYKVKDVAAIAGVSIRALHHYDEIGLLVPKTRTVAGYRLYNDEDLLRLQQILIGRELGLPLEEIRRSLDDPRFDRRKTLLAQKEQLKKRAHQTATMINAIDAALAALDGKKGGTVDMKEIFDGFDPAKYEVEARERWGNTDAYKESSRRTQQYTKEDWKNIKAQEARVYEDAAAAMKSGKNPADAESMDIAERHRLSIDRWYYPCSHVRHCGLASMYESDSRFAANIDKHGEGLTPFFAAAIRANASRPRN